MKMTLKVRIFLSFFIIILLMGSSISLIGHTIIEKDIIQREQKQVSIDLRSVENVFNYSMNDIITELLKNTNNPYKSGDKDKLDYMLTVTEEEKDNIKSEIVKEAFKGNTCSGTRIIEKDELLLIDKVKGTNLYDKSKIEINGISNNSNTKILEKALSMEYAIPLVNKEGIVEHVLYGGKILNKNTEIVDRLRDIVFNNNLYDNKHVGTVTIFLQDIRVATNIMNEKNERAIGTIAAREVYEKVINKGESYIGPLRILSDKYYTAYEPIKDINGNIIGMLYVGILEKPFDDNNKRIIISFLIIILITVICATFLTYMLAESISRPITDLMNGTGKFSEGELNYRININSHIWELNKVAQSLNEMAARLTEKKERLEISNEKLAALNKSHLDLIGFVAHELKGILSSTILNAYTLRDGFLGMINFKQQKALDSITRNLDYLAATVRNFLNLSRMEKGEMKINKTEFSLKEEIFNLSVEAFSKQAIEKGMTIINNIEPNLKVKADSDLMQIVSNNLVGNAIKYGIKDGKIIINSKIEGDKLQIDVYNDGYPIPETERDKLFKKFSRLARPEKKKIRGTGLGLFVTKEIIEKHGGNIWVDVKENGNSFIFTIERGC